MHILASNIQSKSYSFIILWIFFMRLDSFTISLHNFFLKVARVWIVVYSVTSKKLPNVFKSYPKMISLEKFKIFATFTKLPNNVEDFGQNNCCHWHQKGAQSAINRPIWSHWLYTDLSDWIPNLVNKLVMYRSYLQMDYNFIELYENQNFLRIIYLETMP